MVKDGNIDPPKLEPITFDAANNAYLKIAEKYIEKEIKQIKNSETFL